MFLSKNHAVLNQGEDALLDTGSTVCCISQELATGLNLRVEKADEYILWTAKSDQELFHHGITKLDIGWMGGANSLRRARQLVFVIEGLLPHIIL